MSESDKLREELPRITAQLAASMEYAIEQLRAARKNGDGYGDVGRGWNKGVDDALKTLRPAEEALGKFQGWVRRVIAAEPDHCGMTAAERDALFGGDAAGRR